MSTKARISITPDDSRIQRVYEICKPMKSNRGKDSKDDKGGEDEKELLMGNHHTQGTGSEEPNTTAKGKFKSMLWCPTKVAKDPSPPTLDDTSEDDRYEDDDGFPKSNSAGRHMNMQVSDKLKPDFAELEHNHLGSTLWEILTGIQARTKFTNSELKHEGTFQHHSSIRLFFDFFGGGQRRASGNGSKIIPFPTIIASSFVFCWPSLSGRRTTPC